MSSRPSVSVYRNKTKSLCSLVNFIYALMVIQLKESLHTSAWAFKWKKHSRRRFISLKSYASVVAGVLSALRGLKPICPQSILVTISKSLILLHIDHCSAVWGCIGTGLSQKLENLQNRAARIYNRRVWLRGQISSAAPDSPCPPMESLVDRREK